MFCPWEYWLFGEMGIRIVLMHFGMRDMVKRKNEK
jgi:hypothetical protein